MSSNHPIPVLSDLSDASIRNRIDRASDHLSWRLARRIESAYSRILEAGREAEGRHDGSSEYTDLDRVLHSIGVKAKGNVITHNGDGSWATSFTVDRKLGAWEPISIARAIHQQQFTRRALWFWCLLFGNWEYYPNHG